jgi:hypothetical protein
MPSKAPKTTSANVLVADQLHRQAQELEQVFDSHVLTWSGPIQAPADLWIRQAVEHRIRQRPRNRRLAFVLNTPGGYIETAERISNTLRQHYKWVAFMVPDAAMSAGTVLAMSGDEIWMDYFSILGPIDPQVERVRPDGSRGLVPALGYLIKYKQLIEKSAQGQLTTGEAAILVQNFDAAELYHYEQQRQLSITLLKEWLVKYKFKNWKTTATHHKTVTPAMRRQRAEEIGNGLNNPDLWHSHSRGISAQVLRRRLKLRIEDTTADQKIHVALENYYGLLTNYLSTAGFLGALHTADLLLPWSLA